MEESVSLIIVALNRRRETLIQLTLVSPRPYEAVLQEALAMGRRFLESEVGAVRVEIYAEQVFLSAQQKPLVSLTRDDLLTRARKQEKHEPFSGFAQVVKRLLWGKHVSYIASQDATK